MMREQTLLKLKAMQLNGMAKAYEDQLSIADAQTLPFDDRLGLLVDREETERFDRRYQGRLRAAKLREKAAIEDLDFASARGLDKSVILSLASGNWIEGKQNILITGPTGAGKTYMACAFAHKALQLGYTSRYVRLPRLLQEIQIARAEGRYLNILAGLARVDVLLVDDWGLAPLSGEQRRDFLELVEDRYGSKSLLMTSQLSTDKWFDVIGDATIADAIMDRIIHNSHKLELKGPSMRQEKAKSPKATMKKKKD